MGVKTNHSPGFPSLLLQCSKLKLISFFMDVNAKVESSTSKRQKSHGELAVKRRVLSITTGRKECGIERLPEELLSHILSFLETKPAVQASVLSKRWRYVWTSVPCIKLYNYPTSSDSVQRLIERLNSISCLRNFCFKALRPCRLYWFRVLIDFVVVACDLKELELGLKSQDVNCPRTVFTCETLVVLKLNQGILPKVPLSSSVYLPSLKILHLCFYRELFYKDSMKRLLDGCPVLEELNMKGERDRVPRGGKTLFVGSASLKRLRIHAMSGKHWRIVLDVPNVEQLDIAHYTYMEYEIKGSISSLVKLTISADPLRLAELLLKFAHTKDLTIYFQWFEYLRLENFPKFHNLTHLVVYDIDHHHWPVLIALLEFLPKLVTLASSSSCTDGKDTDFISSITQQHMQIKAPSCLMLYLEEIELSRFEGFEDQMEMTRYFLKNSLVLKKLSIQFQLGSAECQLEISRKLLLTFPKGSPECQIIVE